MVASLRTLFDSSLRWFSSESSAGKPQRVSGEYARDSATSDPKKPTEVIFRDGWDARPRYQADEDDEGIFVGRKEILDRLTSDFTSRRSGTILISGVRGVGKTALVEKALVAAREELAKRYWENTAPIVNETKWWRPINSRVREVLREAGRKLGKPPEKSLTQKDAAQELYDKRSIRWFWQRWNPVTKRLRRLHQASRSQLLVMKFNASDIGGAIADPKEEATSGKPNVNPEKLLRALIRKIHSVCHRPWESSILSWSLRRKQRNQFFQNLQAAYDKSISKSYKETISSKVSEALERSRVRTSEFKANAERIGALVVGAAIWFALVYAGKVQGWGQFRTFAAGGAAAVVAYFALTLTTKSIRANTFSRNRDSQFSYEYDYSLARMESDIEEILGVLRPPKRQPFNPLRCFTRKVIVFDELDKLENPIKQLNDVITHFKNFFTLSDALFVFLTDHEFYEHLSIEGSKAQLRRHYSPEHTFFTQKLYLRKPEFKHFKQTVFHFCDEKALQTRVLTGPLDTDLLNFVVKKHPTAFSEVTLWPSLANLTHLYAHSDEYLSLNNQQLERTFVLSGGRSDPMALAQLLVTNLSNRKMDDAARVEIEASLKASKGAAKPLALAHVWAATAAKNEDGTQWRTAFSAAQGWKDLDAVSFLYQNQARFAGTDAKLINGYYNLLTRRRKPKNSASVDNVPFTLTDLAWAICFQTRNHYFDLYYLIYDYVGSYLEGLPVLHMEGERFAREHRLWSRYQQMIDLAFHHKREDHPSREYFNALLMESLYSVFDTRGWGGPVKVEDILFSPEKIAASLQQPPPTVKVNSGEKQSGKKAKSGGGETPEPVAKTEEKASANGRVASTVSVRDAEQINQSLLRLLRIAVARKAVRVSPPDESLLNNTPNLHSISHMTFEWEPDCEPVINQEGLDLEDYEKELIQLWDENQTEIEGLEQQLDRIWRYVEMPSASNVRKVRNLFAELRTTVEGLRYRSKTISSHDAAKLRADLGPPENWISTIADLIVERLGASPVNGIWDSAAIKKGEPGVSSDWRARVEEIERQIGIPPRSVVHAMTSDMLAYLVAGSIPPETDLIALEQSLPKNRTFVFWYAPNHESDLVSQLQPSSAESRVLRFYFSPPANQTVSQLLSDYTALATAARLGVMELAFNTGHKPSALHAGLELFAPLSGLGDLITVLSAPTLKAALDAVDELPTRYKENPDSFWESYGVSIPNWSVEDAAKKIASKIVSTFEWRGDADIATAIENMLRQGLRKEPSRVGSSSALSGTEPRANAKALLKERIGIFLHARLQAAKVTDQKFSEQVQKDFSAWLVNTLATISKDKNQDIVSTLASLPTLAAELERARAAEALTPMPS